MFLLGEKLAEDLLSKAQFHAIITTNKFNQFHSLDKQLLSIIVDNSAFGAYSRLGGAIFRFLEKQLYRHTN